MSLELTPKDGKLVGEIPELATLAESVATLSKTLTEYLASLKEEAERARLSEIEAVKAIEAKLAESQAEVTRLTSPEYEDEVLERRAANLSEEAWLELGKRLGFIADAPLEKEKVDPDNTSAKKTPIIYKVVAR